jgi:two-component sensor histidine kinase
MRYGTEGAKAGSVLGDRAASRADLLLRETNHRCKNDLQLVVSMLMLQLRRVHSTEAREALQDSIARVEVLVQSRTFLHRQEPVSLEGALRHVCEGLQAQAEVRSVIVALEVGACRHRLDPDVVTTVALAVNELAVNALKHAFLDGRSGKVTVRIQDHDDSQLAIIVEDDGLPLPVRDQRNVKAGHFGIDIISRLIASVDGLLIAPSTGMKVFEIRVPVIPNQG